MVYKIKIINGSGQPLTAAKVVFTNDAGEYIATMQVNQAGVVEIDTSFDSGLMVPGMIVNFSAPGYHTYGIAASAMQQNFEVTLVKKKQIDTAVAAGVGIALLAAAVLTKKKSVSGFSIKSLAPAAQVAVVLGLGYVGYRILRTPGANNDLPVSAHNELQQLANQGVYPTMSVSEVEGLASKIETAAAGCGTDEQAIYSAFDALDNRADLMLLIAVYGVRKYTGCFEPGSLFGKIEMNLSDTITADLNDGEIATVNKLLSDRGINYSF